VSGTPSAISEPARWDTRVIPSTSDERTSKLCERRWARMRPVSRPSGSVSVIALDSTGFTVTRESAIPSARRKARTRSAEVESSCDALVSDGDCTATETRQTTKSERMARRAEPVTVTSSLPRRMSFSDWATKKRPRARPTARAMSPIRSGDLRSSIRGFLCSR
jgi:hypothetical protein